MKKILGIVFVLLFIAGNAFAFDPAGAWDSFKVQMKSPGPIGSTTPSTGKFTTLESTGAVTLGGDTTVGSSTAGKNLTVNATLGSDLITWNESAVNEDDVTWTMAGAGALVHVTGNTTAITITITGALTVGGTYQIGINGTGGGDTATYTFGGITGTTIAATGAIAIVDYITATANSELVITPANTCTVSITSVTVKALTDATGDLTVDGDLTVRSKMLVGNGTINTPFLAMLLNPDTGFYYSSTSNALRWVVNGAEVMYLDEYGQLNLTGNNACLTIGANCVLKRDADYAIGMRQSTNQQIFRINNTAENQTVNYERMTLTGVQGASINIIAETNGTGGDNLDIVLTPAGTGQVKNVASNITAGATGTSVSLGHMNRQVYVRTYAAAAFTDSDTTKGIVIATLPAKTKIVGFYADSTATFKGGSVNAATLEVGITAEGAAEIMAPKDIWTATATYGLADADMGTAMTRAAQIQGGYLPSWSGTTAIYATIDTTAGNLNALTTGSVTFYIETERF